jgi:siderophore synthetase component
VLISSLRLQLHHGDLLTAIHHVFSMPGWSFPKSTTIRAMNDPLILWDQFATRINLDPVTRSDISDELASSVRWQAYSYDHPASAPTLSSPSIDWEQSIVEGHPTHPVCVLFCIHKEIENSVMKLDAQDTPIFAPHAHPYSRKL